MSLAAMINLMCRGRKRGLAGVIATQRLAKLAKNVAAEASNFLMGRTFLDIDMARAADLLGMDSRQADAIRDLARGEFLALGPAIARRPVSVRIGAVAAAARSASPKLVPVPNASDEDLRAWLFAAGAEDTRPPTPPQPAPTVHALMRSIAAPPARAVPDTPALDEAAQEALRDRRSLGWRARPGPARTAPTTRPWPSSMAPVRPDGRSACSTSSRRPA